MEEWRSIKGYEGLYWISNNGNVKNKKGDLLKPSPVGKYRNYNTVVLYKPGKKKKQFKIHRLVAINFIENPNPDKYNMVNHIDGDTFNNNVDNLEWCDNSYNQKHAFSIGLKDKNKCKITQYTMLKSKLSANNKAKLIIKFDENYKFLDILNGYKKENRSSNEIGKCCKLEINVHNNFKYRFAYDCLLPYKILCICGKSGSGKNYIYNKLINSKEYNEVISYTTRSKREKEIDGKDYYFINEEEFYDISKNMEFINTKEYNTSYGKWYYGTSINSIDLKNRNIVILDWDGIKNYINKFGRQNLFIIYIDCNEEIRRERYKNRDNNYNEEELKRRFLSDDIDFDLNEINSTADIIFDNSKSTNEDINILSELINIKISNNINSITPIKYRDNEFKYKNKWYFDFKKWYNDNINYIAYNDSRLYYYKYKLNLDTILWIDNKKKNGYRLSSLYKLIKVDNNIYTTLKEYRESIDFGKEYTIISIYDLDKIISSQIK